GVGQRRRREKNLPPRLEGAEAVSAHRAATQGLSGAVVQKDTWDVTESQVFEKTGKRLAEWEKILDRAKAEQKKSGDIVAFLQKEHGVQRYWARTLTTWYGKR